MCNISLFTILVFLMLTTSVVAHSIDIRQTNGPSAGAIKFGMGFSQSNPDIVYVDRYKSTDGGNTWKEFDLPEGAVNNIAVDPENSNIVYLAAANMIYKSVDGAKSWENLGTLGSDDSVVSSLSIKSSNKNTIYAGTTHGKLFISTNAGKNWNDISNKLDMDSPISKISFNSKDADEIYISTGNWYWSSLVGRPKTGDGLFKSIDSGQVFSHIESEFSSYLVQDVDVVGDTVYVTVRYKPDMDGWEGVYKSSDAGKTWTKLIDSRSHSFDFDIGGITHVAVNSNDENHVIISISSWPNQEGKEVSFIVSYDGGQTWRESTEKEPIQYTHELEITSEGKVYAQDYYRPFMKSEDKGETWIWSSQGIRTSRVHSLQIHPTNRNLIFAGTTDGAIHRSFDGGKTWERISTKLSATYVASIEFDPEDFNKFYLGVSGGSDASTGRYAGAPGYDTGLYYTEKSGQDLVKIKTLTHPKSAESENQQLEIYDVFIHPKNPKLIIVGTASEGIYRSEDGGKTWREENTGIPEDGFYWNLIFDDENEDSTEKECKEGFKQGKEVSSACFYYATRTSMNLFVNPHNENEIWYTTLNGVFVSKDLGKTWFWLSDDLKNIHTHFMAFDPSDPKTIYVGTHQGAIDKNGKVVDSSKGLLISRDGGKSWQQVSNGPGEGFDIRAIAVSHKDTDFVAVGTDGPFFVSEDKGKAWEKIELESVEGVDEIKIDSTAKIIYLGTRTNGVWRGILDYSSADPAMIEITGVSSPTSVKKNEVFDVIVSMDNVGGKSHTIPAELKVGDFKLSKQLSLSASDQTSAKFSVMLNQLGTHDILVNGINYGKVSVIEEVKEPPTEKPKEQIRITEPKKTETPPEDDKTEEQPQKNFLETIIDFIVSLFNSLFKEGEQEVNVTDET